MPKPSTRTKSGSASAPCSAIDTERHTMLLSLHDSTPSSDAEPALELRLERGAPCPLAFDARACARDGDAAHFAAAFGAALARATPAWPALAARIAARGIDRIEVRIESADAAFLALPWDAIALPPPAVAEAEAEAAPLSRQAAGFVRRLTGVASRDLDIELDFGLHVATALPDALGAMQPGAGSAAAAGPSGRAADPQRPDAPLRVLHLVAREAGQDDTSLALDSTLDACRGEHAIDYTVLGLDPEPLRAHLAERSTAPHLVRYDGPIASGDAELGGLGALLRQFAQARVAALWIDTGDAIDGATLAATARAAHAAGIGNLIGVAHQTERSADMPGALDAPYAGARAFRALLAQLAAGLPLSAAVQAARRQSGVALIHHGGQPVTLFDSPHPWLELAQSQRLAAARARLLGFQAALLPPTAGEGSDGAALPLLLALAQGRRRLALAGAPGIGKTRAAHRLALALACAGRIDHAFYFDFRETSYTARHLLQMIAPVLGLPADRPEAARDALRSLQCCFVLDQRKDAAPPDEAARQDRDAADESVGTLDDLLEGWAADGHIVLEIEREAGAHAILATPLSEPESRRLARRLASQSDREPPPAAQRAGWDALLAACAGNPLLIERAVALSELDSPETIAAGLREHVSPLDAVETFLAWRWRSLPAASRTVLRAAARVEGLLLEIPMIAIDRPEPDPRAQPLMTLAGAEAGSRFSDWLAHWQRNGFVAHGLHGRHLHARSLPFLRRLDAQADLDTQADAAIDAAFGRMLAEGLRLLSLHLAANDNPPLTHYLLLNRRHWRGAFESLWFGGEPRAFLNTKRAFEQLMRRAGLGAEIAEWSVDLLARTPAAPADDRADQALAWLVLAGDALAGGDSLEVDALAEGARAWRGWLDAHDGSLDDREAGVFEQAAGFVSRLHQRRREWSEAIDVDERLLALYRRREAWLPMANLLRTLARCHLANGSPERARACENACLDEIPDAGAPPGLRARQWFEIAMARAQRGETEAALGLLERLRAREDAAALEEAIAGLQADLDIQRGRHADALPHLARVWTRAARAGDAQRLAALRPRFAEIGSELGDDDLQARLDTLLDEDIERPVPDPQPQRVH